MANNDTWTLVAGAGAAIAGGYLLLNRGSEDGEQVNIGDRIQNGAQEAVSEWLPNFEGMLPNWEQLLQDAMPNWGQVFSDAMPNWESLIQSQLPDIQSMVENAVSDAIPDNLGNGNGDADTGWGPGSDVPDDSGGNETTNPNSGERPSGGQDTVDGSRGTRRGGSVPDNSQPSGGEDTIDGSRGVDRGGSVSDPTPDPPSADPAPDPPDPDPPAGTVPGGGGHSPGPSLGTGGDSNNDDEDQHETIGRGSTPGYGL